MEQNLEIQEICQTFIQQSGIDGSCIFFMDATGDRIMIQLQYIHNQRLGLKVFYSFLEFKKFIIELQQKTNSDRYNQSQMLLLKGKNRMNINDNRSPLKYESIPPINKPDRKRQLWLLDNHNE